MFMKYVLFLAAFFLASNMTAQKIKLKKEIVYADDVPAFSFDKKSMGNEFYLYKLNTKEELLNMAVDNNKTESKVDDSKRIVFTKENITIASKNFKGRDYEFLIALLLEEKAINLKGEINMDNLKRFKAKYDDGNVNHTMK